MVSCQADRLIDCCQFQQPINVQWSTDTDADAGTVRFRGSIVDAMTLDSLVGTLKSEFRWFSVYDKNNAVLYSVYIWEMNGL